MNTISLLRGYNQEITFQNGFFIYRYETTAAEPIINIFGKL